MDRQWIDGEWRYPCKHVYGFAHDGGTGWIFEDKDRNENQDRGVYLERFTYCPKCGERLIESVTDGEELARARANAGY